MCIAMIGDNDCNDCGDCDRVYQEMSTLEQVNEDINRLDILINTGMDCRSERDRLSTLRDEIVKGPKS